MTFTVLKKLSKHEGLYDQEYVVQIIINRFEEGLHAFKQLFLPRCPLRNNNNKGILHEHGCISKA